MFSPSSHDRVAHCLVSEALPHFPETNTDSQHGTEVHAVLEDIIVNGEEVALARAPEEIRELIQGLDRSKLPPIDGKTYAAEVSFAYSPTTGQARELGRGLGRAGRESMLEPGEMGMTLDLVGTDADTVYVGDWKTRYDGHVARVERNPQLRDYALGAARALKRSRAVVFIAWVLDGSKTWSDVAEMDYIDLDAHEAELRELIAARERVISAKPEDRPAPHVGPWCKWCPSIRVCPAHVQAATALAKGQMNAVGELTELTPEIAADAWHKLKMASRYLETIEATLKNYIRSHPVDVGEGFVLAEREKTKERILPDKATPVLQAEFGELVPAILADSLEVTKEISWSALGRALRKHVLPQRMGVKITALEAGLREELRAKGALAVSTYRQVEEFKRPKEPPAEAVVAP